MKLTALEASILERLVADTPPTQRPLEIAAVVASDRELTGVGFFTDLERSPEVQLFDAGVSMRWGSVGARLGSSRIETGYVVYVDDGYVTTIEGFTYGDPWPTEVEPIELYDWRAESPQREGELP